MVLSMILLPSSVFLTGLVVRVSTVGGSDVSAESVHGPRHMVSVSAEKSLDLDACVTGTPQFCENASVEVL